MGQEGMGMAAGAGKGGDEERAHTEKETLGKAVSSSSYWHSNICSMA